MDRERISVEVEDGKLLINHEMRVYVECNASGKTYSAFYSRSGMCAGKRYKSVQAALDFPARVFFQRWLKGLDTETL